jgi:hypothetical protein
VVDKADNGGDVGPDPVWGMGVFIVGLTTMAIGGATTRHYVFNVGEGLLLIGVFWFLATVAITSHRQEDFLTRLRRAIRSGDAEPAPPPAAKARAKKKKVRKKS